MTSRQVGLSVSGPAAAEHVDGLAAELKEVSAHHGLVIVERNLCWQHAGFGDIRR